MRIISQDGKYDMPYEQSCFSIEEREPSETYIRAYGMADVEGFRVAKYSTLQKAKKAMEMLQNKYLSKIGIVGRYNSGCVPPSYWAQPKMFKFPQDDEV